MVSSFAEQYGIRIYSNDFRSMKWNEFKALIAGIGPETPLGRIVSIRAEDDKEVLKSFTPSMRRERAEWRMKMAKMKPQETVQAGIESIKQALFAMAEPKHDE